MKDLLDNYQPKENQADLTSRRSDKEDDSSVVEQEILLINQIQPPRDTSAVESVDALNTSATSSQSSLPDARPIDFGQQISPVVSLKLLIELILAGATIDIIYLITIM